MKIAVNARYLLKDKLEGIGWFSYESLKRIVLAYPEHEFHFFFDRPYDKRFIFAENVIPHVLYPPARHPFLFYLFFEVAVRRKLHKLKPDVFLSTDGYLSLGTNTPSVAVIHDLAFEHYPDSVSLLVRKYYRYFFPRFARKATRIATVSEFSKKDLVKTYGVDAAKIDVVYNGSNPNYHPLPKEEQETVRKKFTNGKPYFVFIGGLYPRKNLKNLLLAFEEFKNRQPSDIQLLIIGKAVWGTEEVFTTHKEMKHTDSVKFLGRINSDDEANRVLASALAMTYVSRFEGFGIPIMEAMQCEIPVITSNSSSMPEVAGKAGCYCDPFSVASIADAMQRVAFDEHYREVLIGEGRMQREKFSWDKTAGLLWECVEQAVN